MLLGGLNGFSAVCLAGRLLVSVQSFYEPVCFTRCFISKLTHILG